MKKPTVIIIIFALISVALVYIYVIKPALANVSTIASTAGTANSVLSKLGL
jgi:hypothetical protein